jgi:magnesium chelatase family protein
MLARVFSCAVVGVDGVVIEVEVDMKRSLPKVVIVGLPDAAVQEARERVEFAVKNAGYPFPRKHITVNLAPASVRKAGPAYDLPIAVGVLIAAHILPASYLGNTMVVGELSLDGAVRHVRGVLSIAATARANGFSRIVVPAVDAPEAALIPDIEVIPAASLAELLEILTGNLPVPGIPEQQVAAHTRGIQTDFKEIKGQEQVKRALEIAAAGRHNMLMTGPPGAGKTLMARALPGILPAMTIEESLDVTRIYSIADRLPVGAPLVQVRPFRAPHHTISNAGLVGGGNWPQPGEISLAHRGVLFLDELPEFGPRVLEVMRQPIEDKLVTIARAQGSLTFPANFQLVAAMNPCPCGYFGDALRACTCSAGGVTRYQKRISGPILDRIDIHIEVPRVDFEKLSADHLGEPSGTIRERVEAARLRQMARFAGHGKTSNAEMGPGEVRRHCVLDGEGQALLRTAARQMQLTARAYHRVLKLARTVADLAGCNGIQPRHLAEALHYRPKVGEG